MRVLDLSRLFPGPYCARILAESGAQVLKIEQPGGGDWTRQAPPLDPESGESLVYRALNRGKKSLTLDLKLPRGRAIFLQLVERSDVVLDTFRPGVMERLGLGYDSLAQTNPRLVYCSLTGYGPGGPYRARAGHDLNYVGLSGLLDLTGPPDGPPSLLGAPIADVAGALWATVGILLALLERERTGRGQRVDSSLLGGALSCLPLAIAQHAGGQFQARGKGALTGDQVCYYIYGTKDGRYVTLSALEPQFWKQFCQAVDRPDLLNKQHTRAIPGEQAFEELRTLFQSRTRQEWLEILEGFDACCEPVYCLEEALSSAPVQALEMLANETVLSPLQFSARDRSEIASAPALGQHTHSTLRELGYDTEAISELKAAGVT